MNGWIGFDSFITEYSSLSMCVRQLSVVILTGWLTGLQSVQVIKSKKTFLIAVASLIYPGMVYIFQSSYVFILYSFVSFLIHDWFKISCKRLYCRLW